MSRSLLRTLIVILTLITAYIHLVVLNRMMIGFTGSIDLLFTLNGLGFLGFLGLFLLDLPFLRGRERQVLYGFIGYTVLTILAWIPGGARNALGYGTKLDELLLVGALILYLRRE